LLLVAVHMDDHGLFFGSFINIVGGSRQGG
jgi:hypothetical protein